MLIGEYQHTLDQKGRMFIPVKFREDLGEKFIITRGIGGCLFGLSQPEWALFSQKLRSLPLTDPDVLSFVRLFFAGATECEVDKQGRILIPSNLRDLAGLDKNVVITGVLSRIEIWSEERWEEYNKEADKGFHETLAKMAQLGV